MGDSGAQPQGIHLEGQSTRNIAFTNMTNRYALPRVINLPEGATVSWEIVTMVDEQENTGIFARIVDDTYFNLFPIPEYERATVVFRATITGYQLNEILYFTVNLRDTKENTFLTLFSPNHLGPQYLVQGIANERMFGLWDLNPDYQITGQTYNLPTQAGERGTWNPGVDRYVTSSSTIRLAWRYRGTPQLEFRILDEDNNLVPGQEDGVIRITPQTTTIGNITREDTVYVEFLGAGTRTVEIRGRSAGTTPWTASYRYTFNIVDGVNAYVFEDIKMIEKFSRLEYIIYGVPGQTTPLADPLNPTTGIARYFTNTALNATNPLLSQHFVRQTTFQDNLSGPGTQFFREFSRWAPSFRYQDIVIRDNMQTWEEGTWFFGSVYGNGFQLDATPYGNNAANRWRNVFGTTWRHTGMENESMSNRRGSGWGHKFAFYQLANDSTICNIQLTGHEIPEGRGTLLNEYRNVSVLGTANLGGGHYDFQVGNRHTNGVFAPGSYSANLTVQNSIIEKGLILIGVFSLINADSPFRVDTTVLRYAGFTAIDARGPTGSEGGVYVRANNDRGQVQGINHRFGNFIVARNIVVYEISTVPVILDDTDAATHFVLEGQHNYFLTWIRLADLVFPVFKLPNTPMHYVLPVPNVSQIAQNLIRDVIGHPNTNPTSYSHVAYWEGAHMWLNIPIMNINNGDYAFICFENSNLYRSNFYQLDVGLPPPIDALNLDARLYHAVTGSITVHRQREIFQGPGLNQIIRAMDISRL